VGELRGRNAAVPLPGQKRSGDEDALGEGQAKGRYRRRARVANPLNHPGDTGQESGKPALMANTQHWP
jgi:hypothetical protein